MSWWDDFLNNTQAKWSLYTTPKAPDNVRSDDIPLSGIPAYNSTDPIWQKRMSIIQGVPNNKNKFGPYLTAYTEKALEPAKAVRTGQYAKLSKGKGQTVPSDWANQRAGDPNYVSSQQQQVLAYVSNPSNGWRKLDDGSFINNSTGQIYNPNTASASSNAPVTYHMGKGLEALYYGNKRFIQVPGPDTDSYSELLGYIDGIPDIMRQSAGDSINPESSSFPTTYRQLTPGQLNLYHPALSSAHEVSHARTAPVISDGLLMWPVEVHGDTMEYTDNYQEDSLELGNSASLFQQQHFRNTGRRIVDKNKFWDDINNAKKNIQDYGPESRRFLQSLDILQNEAPTNPRAADMLMQIQEAMPLITKNKQLPGYNRNYRQNRIG